MDLRASIDDGLSSSESDDEESWPWILSVIFSTSDFSADSCSGACSAIDLRRRVSADENELKNVLDSRTRESEIRWEQGAKKAFRLLFERDYFYRKTR